MARGDLWHKIDTVKALFLDRAGKNVQLNIDDVRYHHFRIGPGLQLPDLEDLMGRDVTTRRACFSLPNAHRKFDVHFSFPERAGGVNHTLKVVNQAGRSFYGEMLIVKLGPDGLLEDMRDSDIDFAMNAAIFTTALVADNPRFDTRKTFVIHTGLVKGATPPAGPRA